MANQHKNMVKVNISDQGQGIDIDQVQKRIKKLNIMINKANSRIKHYQVVLKRFQGVSDHVQGLIQEGLSLYDLNQEDKPTV